MMVSNSFNNRIEPGFNATEKRIEPGLDAAPQPAGTWWYRNAGVSIGPVTDEQMQALTSGKVADRSTMVWRDEFGNDWKRLDETSLWKEPSGPPAFEQPVSPRWQKAFKAVADMEGTWSLVNRTGTRRSMGQRMKAQWTLFSIPGLFLGPLYYFYLRMWRKGVIITGFIPLTILIEDLIGSSRGVSSMMCMFCAISAKRDYFMFRTKGEVMWPWLKVLKNIYVDVGVLAALFVAAIGVEGMQGDTSDVALTRAVADTKTTISSPSSDRNRNGPFTIGSWQNEMVGQCDLTKSFTKYTRREQQLCLGRNECVETLESRFHSLPDGRYLEDVMQGDQLLYQTIYKTIDSNTVYNVGIQNLNRALFESGYAPYLAQAQKGIDLISKVSRFNKCE